MTRALLIGNSDGIGLATTRMLASEGWQLTGVSRSPSPFTAPEYRHVQLDVTSPDLQVTLGRLIAERGPFDVCIYCAGIGEVLDLGDMAREVEVFHVNLVCAVEVACAVLPGMAERGSGHFVVLSSLADQLVSGEAPSYAASKAGLSAYFEGLALALRPSGVAVTTIRFGFVRTKMAKADRLPFVITAEEAARVVLAALRRRPIRVSYPLRSAFVIWLLGVWLGWKVRLGFG
jgi:short-subunit dehydrogenase